MEIPGVFFLPLSLRHGNTPGQPVLRKRLLSISIHPRRFLACSIILYFHPRPFYRKTGRFSPFSILYKTKYTSLQLIVVYYTFFFLKMQRDPHYPFINQHEEGLSWTDSINPQDTKTGEFVYRPRKGGIENG